MQYIDVLLYKIDVRGLAMQVNEWRQHYNAERFGFHLHQVNGGTGWHYPEHTHKGFCELVCATHGTFRHVINGRGGVQESGEMVFIRDRDVHETGGRKFVYVNVAFPLDWLKRLEHYMDRPGELDGLLSAADPPRTTILRAERYVYNQWLSRLLQNMAHPDGRCYFAQFLLFALWQHLNPGVDRGSAPGCPDWLREVLSWLEQKREPLPSLQDLVRRSGRCHEHFTRQFTRYIGATPSRYLATRKIDRAAGMLVTTNRKLMDICQEAGFANESYFFRLFRQFKGMSPRAYRQTHGPRSISVPRGFLR